MDLIPEEIGHYLLPHPLPHHAIRPGRALASETADPEDLIHAFGYEFDHDLPLISEAFEGPAHRAYRVMAYPTKYLVDRYGDLLCGGPGPSFWDSFSANAPGDAAERLIPFFVALAIAWAGWDKSPKR